MKCILQIAKCELHCQPFLLKPTIRTKQCMAFFPSSSSSCFFFPVSSAVKQLLDYMLPHRHVKGDILCSFFWVHILFLVTTRASLHALMLKKTHLFSHTADCSSPVFFQDFCLCFRCSVLAPALRLKAYSALIGQLKHTPSRWTYREA